MFRSQRAAGYRLLLEDRGSGRSVARAFHIGCSAIYQSACMSFFQFSSDCLRVATVVSIGCTVPLHAAATAVLPSAPSGFSTPAVASGSSGDSGMAGGVGETIFRGFTLVTSLSGIYDTNVTQSPGGTVAPVRDDFILSLGGVLSYMSKAPTVTFGGSYRGSYNQYFSESDYSGYNQGATGVVNYSGGRVTASFTAGIDYDEGSNRNYASAFVRRTNVTTQMTGAYRFSKKTSIRGNLGYGYSTTSGGNFSDTDSFDAGVSALWKYSPLTELGPGLRYTYRSGSSQTGRSSIGPTLHLNYQLSTKVSLTSRFGVDFASYDDGGSVDPTFSTSVGLDYQASRLWGMNVSLYRDTQADPSIAGSFTEITSMRVGYHRKVRRAMWQVGVGFDTNRSESPNGASSRGDRDYFTADTSVGMAILSNTTFARVFLRYADQSGQERNSWDSVQTGFSLSRSF